MLPNAPNLIAADIGNSRIKLARFPLAQAASFAEALKGRPSLAPSVDGRDSIAFDGRIESNPYWSLFEQGETLYLPILDRGGQFDDERLAAWCQEFIAGDAEWFVASVHRGAADRLSSLVNHVSAERRLHWPLRRLTYQDVPLAIHVDEPHRVGIDRLLAATAVNCVRDPERAAIVVDLGTAIKVDLVSCEGAFAGGAILPGIGISARALHEFTDALPHIARERLDVPPPPLGKSTTAAIESGLFWGAVGAIRELVAKFASGQPLAPELFLTGGASPEVAKLLRPGPIDDESPPVAGVFHVPHLVLAGIAIVAGKTAATPAAPGQ
jgi:pantothenate kinase type III